MRAVPLAEAPADVDVVVLAVPSRAFRAVAEALPGDAPVLSLAKGLDPATGERLSTLVRGRPVAVLSGPNMAEEIAEGLPTAAVIASEDGFFAGQLQHAITSPLFRAYVNPDVVGVELCAAAKNVIALAAGGVDGIGLGDNAKAAVISRGLAEMSRLGEAAGARPETFSGLAGMGDLIVTCWSRHGRNRHAGELIAHGLTPDQAVAEVGQTVEGVVDRADALRARPPARRGVADHGGGLRGTLRGESPRSGVEAHGSAADRGVGDALADDPGGGSRCRRCVHSGRLRRRFTGARRRRAPRRRRGASCRRTAVALVAVDTDLGSGQWQAVNGLLAKFPAHDALVTQLRQSFEKSTKLSWANDVKPALGRRARRRRAARRRGREGGGRRARPARRPAALDALVAKLSAAGGTKILSQSIGGWTALSESQAALDAVAGATSHLADDGVYQEATGKLAGDALVRAYANGAEAKQLLAALGKSAPAGAKGTRSSGAAPTSSPRAAA